MEYIHETSRMPETYRDNVLRIKKTTLATLGLEYRPPPPPPPLPLTPLPKPIDLCSLNAFFVSGS